MGLLQDKALGKSASEILAGLSNEELFALAQIGGKFSGANAGRAERILSMLNILGTEGCPTLEQVEDERMVRHIAAIDRHWQEYDAAKV